MYAANRIYKYRKAVPRIFHAFLITESAERLARRTTYYYVDIFYFGIIETYFKKLVIAFSFKIPVIRINSLVNHFKADSPKSHSLKTKRQASATSKQVQDHRRFLYFRLQQSIYIFTVFCHLKILYSLFISLKILSHDGQTLQRQVVIDDVCHECQHQYSVYGEGEELGQVIVGVVHAEIE